MFKKIKVFGKQAVEKIENAKAIVGVATMMVVFKAQEALATGTPWNGNISAGKGLEETGSTLFGNIFNVAIGLACLLGSIFIIKGFVKLSKQGKPGGNQEGSPVFPIMAGAALLVLGIVLGVVKTTMTTAGQ